MKKGNVLEIKDLSVDFMTVRGIVDRKSVV